MGFKKGGNSGWLSNPILILSILLAYMITFGGIGKNAFGHSTGIGGSLAYLIIILIDLPGWLVGKIILVSFTSTVSGTILEPVFKFGGGIVIYTITTYFWLIYARKFIKGYKKRAKR